MILELSLENALAIASIACGGVMGLWMRSVNAHNKMLENQSKSVENDIDDIEKEIEEVRSVIGEIRDLLQQTRESYVVDTRFEKFTDVTTDKFNQIMQRFDVIAEKIEAKSDKIECLHLRKPFDSKYGEKL